jgi:hypothetical protein
LTLLAFWDGKARCKSLLAWKVVSKPTRDDWSKLRGKAPRWSKRAFELRGRGGVVGSGLSKQKEREREKERQRPSMRAPH